MPSHLLRAVEVDLSETAQWRSAFRDAILSIVRPLWRGQIDYYQAYDAMDVAITNGFTRAWWDGADDVGITPSELTPEERFAMQEAILNQRQYIHGFLSAIEEHSRANGYKLSPHLRRAELWIKRYDDVKNQARVMAGKDKKLKWVRDARDSCRSCISLEGKVKRASFWKDHVMPQSPKLECVSSAGGVPVCRCSLVPTDEPCSPGPLPMGL